MLVHAFITSVRASPEPTVLAILDGLNKVLANLVRGGLGVAMLAHDHIPQLLLVPISHIILLLRLFLLLLVDFSGISVQRLLGAIDIQIVTEFTLLAFLTSTLFEELTQHRLGVHTERHFLDLDRLEQLGGFALCGFGGELFLFTGFLLGLLALGLGRLCCVFCLLDLLDVFLCGSTLFVFHTERLVDGDLVDLWRRSLLLWWHDCGCVGVGLV